MRRVVVTGMGVISPIGNDIDTFWNSIKEEKTGFGSITKFDTSEYKVKIAAEVKDFNPADYMDEKTARRMEPFSQYAIAASYDALKDSGLVLEDEDIYRIGVSIGSGTGSLQAMEREYEKLLKKGPGRVSPLFVPMMISNMAAGNVAIRFGLRGKNINVVTACATGTHSIGEAYRSIQYGDADVMLAGGAEAAITPLGVAGFTSLKALTTCENLSKVSIPFDKDRSGFVMGEGAGVVVLEEYERAVKRGAHIYAEVAGYGASCDAYHITSPLEDGAGAAAAMLSAIRDAKLEPEDIYYINAHGTSTHHNDLFETRAIKAAFGAHAYDMKINSTKSMTGHMLGAAGAVEFITCVKSINDSYIHATVGYEESDDEMDLDYTKEAVNGIELKYALSNSLGFGGHNASILVKQ